MRRLSAAAVWRIAFISCAGERDPPCFYNSVFVEDAQIDVLGCASSEPGAQKWTVGVAFSCVGRDGLAR